MVAFPYDVTRTRVFGDGALTRMADVLDEVCAKRHIADGSEQRTRLA